MIFAEQSSGKFVQFAGSVSEPLLLDLPVQTLSPQEHATARKLFSNLGDNNRVKENATGFQIEFGEDTTGAARITMQVFQEVYGFPENVELTMTEN